MTASFPICAIVRHWNVKYGSHSFVDPNDEIMTRAAIDTVFFHRVFKKLRGEQVEV